MEPWRREFVLAALAAEQDTEPKEMADRVVANATIEVAEMHKLQTVTGDNGEQKFEMFGEDGKSAGFVENPFAGPVDFKLIIGGTEFQPDLEHFAFITSPEMIAVCETRYIFHGRDRRRIKREIRKAIKCVRVGTYKFSEPPPGSPVYEL
jgi:hypothetical protein